MKKLFIILFSLVCFTSFGFAQWSMGLSVGPDYSHYNYDVQWAYDFRLKSYWGVAMEVPLSYAVNDWFSIKSGVSFQERGYCLLRSHQYSKYSELNRQDLFLSLPIEAVFSFGGRKLKKDSLMREVMFHIGCVQGIMDTNCRLHYFLNYSVRTKNLRKELTIVWNLDVWAVLV